VAKIYLLRHNETELNQKSIIIGHLDPSIVEDGKDKIHKLALKIPNNVEIYSSPLKRAKETAEIIAKKSNKKIIYTDLLKEINYGELQGKNKKIIKNEYPRYHVDSTFKNPGGESFDDLYQRTTKFIESLNLKKDYLIVTHAGCIRTIISYLKKESIQKNISMKINHYQIYCWDNDAQKLNTI